MFSKVVCCLVLLQNASAGGNGLIPFPHIGIFMPLQQTTFETFAALFSTLLNLLHFHNIKLWYICYPWWFQILLLQNFCMLERVYTQFCMVIPYSKCFKLCIKLICSFFPVAQSVAMRAVNQWVVSLNPSLANIRFICNAVWQNPLWHFSDICLSPMG